MDFLFLDANIFFAATASETGASRFLFELAKIGRIKLLSSFYALGEAKINIEKKLSEEKLPIFFELTSHLHKIQKEPVEWRKNDHYPHLINPKDLPILLDARKMKADFLITLDRKDFKTPKLSNAKLPFQIMLPGEYLQKFIR